MKGQLILEDGTKLEGDSFGYESSIAGEMVFSTGMVGYPESLTDPSFAGQILIFTYPLIGNYGVPESKFWESERIQTAGIIVSTYNETPSHFQSTMSLADWLKKEKIPGLVIKDTRFLAKKLREQGAMLGKIVFDPPAGGDIPFHDPNKDDLVAHVSTKKIMEYGLPADRQGKGNKTIIMIDCGMKRNQLHEFVKRGVKVVVVPHDYDFFDPPAGGNHKFDAVFISNGPGDPKMAQKTISIVKKSLENKIPTFGICLGNQILTLAAGGDTYKLKFGHRSQNQPALEVGTNRSYLTTQNHGFAVGDVPSGFKPWFINANDNTNEGIIHTKYPLFSVQFHPESTPGPFDTTWLFDYFLEKIK